ncbi:TIGR03085 family metal-binding protein [Cryptosporangium minutisporangium]|uniref:TIGR03085 family metal-binding protein n=1 Tax=Cryptosporangium minutisporangium TaxID=113569 RepID=A0ABP6T121_9ACTN
MPTIAQSERAALADLFEAIGPDAPTLCSGWTTADLAAHLVVRERRPDSAPGIRVAALAGWTERVRLGALRDRGYEGLITDLRSGPPRWSPFGLPGVDGLANSVEMFVHHEDVRRAQDGWEPRPLPAGAQKALWRTLGTARMLLRSAPSGVTLAAPGFGERVAKPGEPMVVVTGEPGELVLFCFGRQDHSRVTIEGDAAAAERLRTTDLGI